MKSHYHLLLYGLGLLLGGCTSGTGPGDSTTIKDLFPLAYGDYWTYHIKYYNAYDTSHNSEWQTTNEVVAENVSNGHHIFTIDDGVPNGSIFYYFSGADLFIGSNSSFNNDTTIQRILRYPLARDSIIELVDSVSSPFYRSMLFLKLSMLMEYVTVPAGSFWCYRYQNINFVGDSASTSPVPSEDSYYAAGVGLVKRITYQYLYDLKENKIVERQELISYRVE